jgi:hypothetical protein
MVDTDGVLIFRLVLNSAGGRVITQPHKGLSQPPFSGTSTRQSKARKICHREVLRGVHMIEFTGRRGDGQQQQPGAITIENRIHYDGNFSNHKDLRISPPTLTSTTHKSFCTTTSTTIIITIMFP